MKSSVASDPWKLQSIIYRSRVIRVETQISAESFFLCPNQVIRVELRLNEIRLDLLILTQK